MEPPKRFPHPEQDEPGGPGEPFGPGRLPADGFDPEEEFDSPEEVDAVFRSQRRLVMARVVWLILLVLGVPIANAWRPLWWNGWAGVPVTPAWAVAAGGGLVALWLLGVQHARMADRVERAMLGRRREDDDV